MPPKIRLPIFINIRFLLLLLVAFLPVAGRAQYQYVTNNGTIEIVKYSGAGGSVTIPSTIDGLPVTVIKSGAFYDAHTTMTEVIIPSTVTTIEGAAFYSCVGLGSVILTNGLLSIGSSAFGECVGLTNLTLPPGLSSIGYNAFHKCGFYEMTIPGSVTTIGTGAFSDCFSLGNLTITNGGMIIESEAFRGSGLTNLTITNATVSLGSSVFQNCSNLMNVTLGFGVTNIGESAFTYCVNLTNIDLPNSLQSIPIFAFSCCRSLATISIPASVTTITFYAFNSCTSLTEINVNKSNTAYFSTNGVLFNKSRTSLVQYPPGKRGAYAVPEGTKVIADYSFETCMFLSDISIPNSVTSIGGVAFAYCYSLTNLVIPEGVSSIGVRAFYYCYNIDNISIPATVTSIGDYAFDYCEGLTAINVSPLSEDYSSLDGVMFNKAQTTLLQYPLHKSGAYVVPNSVTTLASYAFYNCNALTTVVIPQTVLNIELAALARCSATNLAVDEANPVYSSIDGTLFNKNQTTLVQFSAGRYGGWFTNYTVPNGVTTIGAMAFYGCETLTKIVVPNSVTQVGNDAFSYCYNLYQLHFLGNAPSVQGYLYGDYSTTVYYQAGTTGWGPVWADRPTAEFDVLNYTFIVTNGTVTITKYIGSDHAVTLPSTLGGFSVRRIQPGVFFASTTLTSVTLPDSLATIDDQLFAYCRNLTNVTLPNSITNIGDRVFTGCTNLVQFSFGNGIKTIGSEAFKDCTRLTNIILPQSITDIGEQAFTGCTGLTNITLPPALQTINPQVFEGCTALMSIVIPENVTGIRTYAFHDCTNLTAVTLPNSLTYIDTYAFDNCGRLGSIIIPNNVFAIGEVAFRGCRGLTNVTIGNSVYAIGYYAFDGCSQLTTLTIPASITYLGSDSFRGCTNLTGIYFLGNAPTADNGSVFADDNKLTVYYLAGATGWEPTYSYVHTVALGATPPAPTIQFPTNGFQTITELQQVHGRVAARAAVTSIIYQLSNTLSGAVMEGTATGTSNWTTSVTLLPGTNVFRAKAVNPFGESVAAVTHYVLLRTNALTVLTNGFGRVSPNYNGKSLFLGKPYVVTALPGANQLFSGWVSNEMVISTSPTLPFIMQSNLVLQANFIANPFIPVADVYNGLFYNANNLAQESSGFVTLTVSANQNFAGKLLLDGRTNAFRGRFDSTGAAQVVIARAAKGALTLALSLDLANGTDTVTGTVTATNFVSELTALRAVFDSANLATNFNGQYVIAIGGSSNAGPAAPRYGYALCTVRSNGVVALSGNLGDGTAVNAAGPLLKGGKWPLHLRLYNGAGSFTAWLTFGSHAVTVDSPFPLWFKRPTNAKLYPGGFTESSTTLVMDGAIHIPPSEGTPYLSSTNGSVHLFDGNLPSEIVESFTVSPNNVVTMAPGTNHLTIFLNATNGTFTGRFVHSVTHVTTAIKGSLTPDIGLGYFIGTNRSGSVVIQPE